MGTERTSRSDETAETEQVHSATPVRSSAGIKIQARLRVGPVGDRYEQEADEVARQVVHRMADFTDRSGEPSGRIRAAVRPPGDFGPDGVLPRRIQLMSVPGRTIGPRGGETEPDTEIEIRRAMSGGEPLEPKIRGFMQEELASDFSGVRVHHNEDSDKLNRQLQATAFTTGNHVFFRDGAYNPSSSSGQELIAHELTHVVQQGGTAQRSPATVQRDDDLYSEVEDEYAEGYADADGDLYDVPEGLADANYDDPADLGLPAEALAKYRHTTERGEEYKNEFKEFGIAGVKEGGEKNFKPVGGSGEKKRSSGEFDVTGGSQHLPAIFKAGAIWALKNNKSVDEYMIKFFGWSQDDVDKYWNQGKALKVHKMDEEERSSYVLYGGSSLKQGVSDQAYDTSKMFSKHSGAGFGIFVMANDGTFYADQHKVGLFHHSTFLAGGDVACGGEIKIVSGAVKVITNKTGHYRSGDVNLWQALDELKSRGVSLGGIEVRNVPGKKTPYEGGAEKFYEDKRLDVAAATPLPDDDDSYDDDSDDDDSDDDDSYADDSYADDSDDDDSDDGDSYADDSYDDQ